MPVNPLTGRQAARPDAGVYAAAQRRAMLIVFDLDGTISDSRELARESFKRVFALLGCGMISDEQADAFNGPDADEVCQAMGVTGERRALYGPLLDEVESGLFSSLAHMFPGTEQMIRALAPLAHLAILTNGSVAYCEESVRAFGLGPYLSRYSGYVSGISKARRIALWKDELHAERVAVVGDRHTDIENARKAGAVAVGVTYGMGDREELADADYLCDTPEALKRTLLRLIAQE